MLMNKKLSPLARCVLLTLPPVLLITGNVTNANAAACNASPTTTCGVSPYKGKDLYFDQSTGSAFINDETSEANVYMGPRTAGDVQFLTISGTDMSGKYIQASYSGEVNITMENNSQADMIEVGRAGASTATHIIIDDSVLNGEQDTTQYNTAVGDKAYMMGAAIYIDSMDSGIHNIDVRNGSRLNGSIITGGAAAQTVSLDSSSLTHGGIYSISLGSDNLVSLNHAQLDASQSPVAAKIKSISQQISQLTGVPVPLNLTNLDDMAIGLAGNHNNTLTLTQSAVTGDIGLMNQEGANLVTMQDSSVDGSIMLSNKTGNSQLMASGSTVTGDVGLESQGGQTLVSLSGNSVIEGDLTLSDANSPVQKSSNTALKASPSATQVSLSSSTVQGNLDVSKSAGPVSVVLDSGTVGGNLVITTGSDGTSLSVQNNSQIAGDVTLSGTGKADVMVSASQLDGNLDTSANSGDTSIIIGDASTVAGDVKTGGGNDSIVIVGGSQVQGDIDGGNGSNNMVMDSSSTFDGQLTNVSAVYATQDNSIVTPAITGATGYTLMNKSMLVGQTMSDANISMSTDSSVMVTGTVTGLNTLTISQMAKTSQEGQSVIGSFNDMSQGTINYQFSNGGQHVAARSGAWNYDVTASSVPMNNSTGGAEIVINQTHTGLANDVKGAIAGLDGAKQSGQVVVADIASRMDDLRSSFLLHGVSEGAHLWGDYLYQNGDFTDDADYHSNLQGMQGGVDWSHKLINGDSVTGGIALAYTRNRISNGDNQGNFNNAVYGNFYSLYGGWQQHLRDNRWSLFADGSFSLGDMRYSLSAHNVQSSTTGMQEALTGSYDGNMYDAETRAGINIKTRHSVLIQPYAVLGWNETQSDAFSDAQISFGKNQTSSWHTGAGIRMTGNIETARGNIMPWADARYISEFSDDTDISAADYRDKSGHNQKMGIFGAGVNVGVTKNLHFTSGIYTGAGDVNNSVSVQAGLNYNF